MGVTAVILVTPNRFWNWFPSSVFFFISILNIGAVDSLVVTVDPIAFIVFFSSAVRSLTKAGTKATYTNGFAFTTVMDSARHVIDAAT